jgi:hypothetical protein
MTAYRQSALRCAALLAGQGPSRAADVARATGVPGAGALMRRDVYGWFERIERGIYGLTPRGTTALATYADEVVRLGAVDDAEAGAARDAEA